MSETSYEVTVCVPTLNESESIGDVVSNIVQQGYEPVIIDGGSTDGTAEIAEENGGKVIKQSKDGGKGAAVVEMLDRTDGILVLIDGDCTYEPKHIDRLTKPIIEGDYDHVIGNRFHNITDDAMSLSHQFGNKGANLLFRVLYGRNLQDILSGFRAINTDSFDADKINSRGFDIETELCAYSVKNEHNIGVIGTNYYDRKGESKLGEVTDTLKICKRMIYCKLN